MLSSSSIRYLLAIYELSDGGAAVCSVDVSRVLGVSRASVVKGLKKLAAQELIRKEYYGNIQLTPLGVRESNRIFTEYTLLHAYFSNCAGFSPENARADAISALCAFSAEGKEALMQRALRAASDGASP